MFGLTLTIIVTAMHGYVFWRIKAVTFLGRRFDHRIRGTVFLSLWIAFLLGRLYGHGNSGPLAASLEFIGMNWMAALFLMTACLFTVDMVTVFGLLWKPMGPRLRSIALGLGLALSVVAMFQGLRPPVVNKYDVYLPNLPDAMDKKVIVGMSDLHLGSMLGKRWLRARVSQVQSIRPDLIVLLGDMFEGHSHPDEELLSIFHLLYAPLGVWAVQGNHDTRGSDDLQISRLKDNGILMLTNTWAEPVPGFYIAGVKDLRSHYRSGNRRSLIVDTLETKPRGGATVLLSHIPRDFGQAARRGVGLMLSGHTHGGQIWPFDYIVKRNYPKIKGKFSVGQMTVIITRGAGTWGPRMRLWSPGEILHITLHGKKSST